MRSGGPRRPPCRWLPRPESEVPLKKEGTVVGRLRLCQRDAQGPDTCITANFFLARKQPSRRREDELARFRVEIVARDAQGLEIWKRQDVK